MTAISKGESVPGEVRRLLANLIEVLLSTATIVEANATHVGLNKTKGNTMFKLNIHQRCRRSFERLIGLSILCLSGVSAAANVDLTVSQSVTPAAPVAFVPYSYQVVLRNNEPTLATNPVITLTLSADMVSRTAMSVVAAGGAVCPTVAQLSTGLGNPPLAGGSFALTVPSIPASGQCILNFSVIPLRPANYTLSSNFAVTLPDVETQPTSNTATTNSTVGSTIVRPGITKRIVSGGAPATFPAVTVWEIVITGDPTISIPPEVPMLLQDRFYRDTTSTVYGASTAAVDTISCTSTGFSSATAGCPVLPVRAASAWDDPIFWNGQRLPQGLPANSSVTIRYSSTITAPTCGTGGYFNQASVFAGDAVNPFSDIVQPPSVSRVVSLPAARACNVAFIPTTVTKTLLGPALVNTIANKSRYQITYGISGATVYPAEMRVGDSITTDGAGYLERMNVISCTASGGMVCPAALAAGSSFGPFAPTNPFPNNRQLFSEIVRATADGSIRLVVEMEYSDLTARCMPTVWNQTNSAGVSTGVGSIPPSGFDLVSVSRIGATVGPSLPSPTPAPVPGYVQLDFDLPRCVDLTVNKSISTPRPGANVPFSFDLEFTNAGSAIANNPAINVPVTDVLGSHFTPSAVTCSVVEGTGTAPTVSLANITGANQTFATTIPLINVNSKVRCRITGTVATTGSYSNTVSTLASWGGSGRTSTLNVSSGISSTQGYGVTGASTTSVTKVLGINAAGVAPGTTFPVTAQCTITPIPAGPPTFATVGPISLTPGVAQVFTLPPSTAAQSTSCVFSEGTPSQAALPTFGYLPGIFTPSATVTTSAIGQPTAPLTLTNNLSPIGTLAITKAISGGPTGGINSGAFTFSVACTPNTSAIPNQTITFGPAASTSQSLTTNLQVAAGDRCTVTELTRPTPPAGFAWGPIPAATVTAPIVVSQTTTATVTNTLINTGPGGLLITKVVTGGPTGGVSGAFNFSVNCTLGSPIPNQTITLTNQTTRSLASPISVPAGAVCTVTELAPLPTPPTNFSWAPIPAAAVTSPITAGATTIATVTNTLVESGGLQITKVVTGGPVGGVSGAFVFAISCSAGGPYADQTITLTNETSRSLATAVRVPVGATCSVQERSQAAAPSGFSWVGIPAAVSSAAMPATGGVSVTVTNVLASNAALPMAQVPVNDRTTLAMLGFILLCTAGIFLRRQ